MELEEDIKMGENDEKRVPLNDFKAHDGVRVDKSDPYDLKTPFGDLNTKNPFKSNAPLPWDQSSNNNMPFSGNTKKCPGCGSNMYFDEEIGSLICRSCGNLYDPDTMEMNGSLGIENPEQEYGIDDDIDYADRSNKEIACNSCGSQIVTDANTAATICPFCGSPMLVTRRLTRQFRPDALIPFTVTREQAKKAYFDHVSSVPHVPKAFTREATIEKISGVYVPFWLMSADVKMEIGGWEHIVMDGSPRYDPIKQEATGQHSMDVPIDGMVEFSLKNVPFDGSHKIPDRLMQACEPFDFSELVPYNASYLIGFLAEKYDSQPKDMYDVIRKRLDNYCHEIAESVKFEDVDYFTYNSSYTGITYKNYRVIYCLLPIWFLNVNYGDRSYKFAVNGQTGEVCGVVPESLSGDLLRRMAEKVNNVTYRMNRTARHMFYILPSALLGALYLGLRISIVDEPSHGLDFIVIAIILFIIFTGLALFVAPTMVSREREKNSLSGIKDPHSLDRMPNVSFYLDTSRKIRAKKKLTQGGAYGIVNPTGKGNSLLGF